MAMVTVLAIRGSRKRCIFSLSKGGRRRNVAKGSLFLLVQFDS